MAPRKKGRPVTLQQRAQVVDLHAKGLGRNEIAKLTGIGAATVSKIVKDDGGSFNRSKVKAATAARKVDLAAERARLAERLLAKAHDLVDDMDAKYTAFNFGGKDNTYAEHTLDKPPTEALRNLIQSASIASKEARELSRFDGDGSEGERSMLADLGRALGIQ